MGTKTSLLAAIMVSAIAGGAAAAQDRWACSPWESATPDPYPLRLATIVSAQGRVWAFGETGAAVSADGRKWNRVSRISGRLSDVLWTGTEFIGTSDSSILASPDGITWTTRIDISGNYKFTGYRLRSIAWNGQKFVAVGEGYGVRVSLVWPVVLTSPDGVTWSSVLLPPAGDPSNSRLREVIWTGELFAAIGSFLVTSPDGEEWSVNTAIEGRAIASGAGTTVVAGSESFRVSGDLVNWQLAAAPVSGAHLSWAGGFFFASGLCGACPDRESALFWSNDGVAWQRAAFDVPVRIRAVADHGEELVAVGDGVAWSAGGESWRSSHAQLSGTVTAIAAGENGMVAVGFGGELLRSADGRAWRRVFWGGTDVLSGVAWGNNGFLAVGDGVVLTSPDGENWTASPAPGGAELWHVVANNKGFVTVGGRRLFTSPDGVNWQEVDLLPLVLIHRFVDLEASPDTFVVSVRKSYSGGAILASEDGLNWRLRVITSDSLPALAWGGGRFLTMDRGKVLSSSDGMSWQTVAVGLELANLTWIGSRFVGWKQSANRILTSIDGSLWQPMVGPMQPRWRAVFGFQDVLWMAAENGVIMRSICGEVGSQMDVPTMAHLPGAQGTVWRSDLVLHNPGAEPATVGMVAAARGDSDPDGWAAFTLEAGETRWLEDVLAAELAMEGAATVRVTSWGGAVLGAGRTYNQTPSGSFGQFVPPFKLESAIAPGGESRLIGLSHAAERTRGFRTNIGLVNPTAEAVSVDIELFAGDGLLLGVVESEVAGNESLQLNDVFRSVTTADVADGFAVVRPASSGGPVHAYGSVIDNLSGDSAFVVPAVVLTEEVAGWIPGAGHVRGLNRSVWRTDLQLHNPESRDTECQIDLFPWGAPGSAPAGVTVRVPGRSSLRLPDVVGAQFGWKGGASLRITPLDGPVMLNARTYTPTDSGTVGQGVPAFTPDQEIVVGRPKRLISLRQHPSKTTGFRSNLGLVNTTDAAAIVHIDLLHPSGQAVSSLTRSLHPWESVQLTEVLRGVDGLGGRDAAAVVRVTTPGARVLAYGCLIDNRTNDPILVPAATP